MKDKLVGHSQLNTGACAELHDGPHEALAWCDVPWRLQMTNNINDTQYAMVPANMLVPLPVDVLSYGRAESGLGYISKIVTRMATG